MHTNIDGHMCILWYLLGNGAENISEITSLNVAFSNVLEKGSPDSPWWLEILKVAIKMLREGYNKFAKELIHTDDTFR